MKKKLILSVLCLFAISAYGQDVNEQDLMKNVNWKEDSTEITTINDIIKMQQDVTSKTFTERHFHDVWGRKSYLNVSYNNTTLTPDQTIPTGVNNGTVPEFKTDWGASLQVGRSYALHKNPIANILQFNLDYSYIDLNVNHFKAENDGKNIYDSRAVLKYNNDGKDYFYTPWNVEKYDFNYGMALGPSICIAPFTSTNANGLHHLKLNLYYHIGYHVSLLYMKSNDDADVNKGSTSEEKIRSDKMKDISSLDLGHGLINSFGFSIVWKAIGLGFEHRSASLKYKSLSTDNFSKEEYSFKSGTSRFFIQFRM